MYTYNVYIYIYANAKVMKILIYLSKHQKGQKTFTNLV